MTGTDNGFCVFDTLNNGTRAGIINLVHQAAKHNTLTKLITAYAPPSENDTEAYIAYVSKETGIKGSDNIYSKDKICPIGLAIVNYEGNYKGKVSIHDIVQYCPAFPEDKPMKPGEHLI